MLYEDIVKMYGDDWDEEEIDVDLPFVISKKKTPDNVRYKNDFTKILLIFDLKDMIQISRKEKLRKCNANFLM